MCTQTWSSGAASVDGISQHRLDLCWVIFLNVEIAVAESFFGTTCLHAVLAVIYFCFVESRLQCLNWRYNMADVLKWGTLCLFVGSLLVDFRLRALQLESSPADIDWRVHYLLCEPVI